jgi:hypothetical protein
VHGSDEEIDDQLDVGSDEDFSDDGDKSVHDEVYFLFYVSSRTYEHRHRQK